VKLVIQRVSRAEVRVGGAVVGRIGTGMAVLVGLERGDGEEQLERAARRLITLRVFEDEAGRINRGLDEVGGELLLVSQFTLARSIRGRHDFDRALPAGGGASVRAFVNVAGRRRGCCDWLVQGADGVELVNDGPVTLLWDDPPGGGDARKTENPEAEADPASP
jgi:D-tyrosyl-tRNA(Tyr) deacylase